HLSMDRRVWPSSVLGWHLGRNLSLREPRLQLRHRAELHLSRLQSHLRGDRHLPPGHQSRALRHRVVVRPPLGWCVRVGLEPRQLVRSRRNVPILLLRLPLLREATMRKLPIVFLLAAGMMAFVAGRSYSSWRGAGAKGSVETRPQTPSAERRSRADEALSR